MQLVGRLYGVRRVSAPASLPHVLATLLLSLILALAPLATLSLSACGGGGGGESSASSDSGSKDDGGKGDKGNDDAGDKGEPEKSEDNGGGILGGLLGGDDDKGEATGADFKLPKDVKIPSVADSGGDTTIDTSGVNSGWVGARGKSSARLKFQILCGDLSYVYDMPNDGSATCFPINMGNGSYTFRVMENVEGSNYAELDSATADVSLSSEFDPFLVPNIYCSYKSDSNCVKKARELMDGVENQGEAVREICTFVADNITYDDNKAAQLANSTGYVPDPDATLADKSGVCFDYASLAAAMLRSVGIPAQVVTGYVNPDNLYHAWTMVYVDGTWQTAQFSISPNTWSRCDVTFASAGAGATIGDGTTYTDRYVY